MKTIPRITAINAIQEFVVYVTFTNGELRSIDFDALFKKWKVKTGDVEYPLLKKEAFQQVCLINQTLAWKNVTVTIKGLGGKQLTTPYDLSPEVLFEHSELMEIDKTLGSR